MNDKLTNFLTVEIYNIFSIRRLHGLSIGFSEQPFSRKEEGFEENSVIKDKNDVAFPFA